jgi:hypothetical protein
MSRSSRTGNWPRDLGHLRSRAEHARVDQAPADELGVRVDEAHDAVARVSAAENLSRDLYGRLARADDENLLADLRVAQEPVRRHAPQNHQRQSQRERDERHAAPYAERGHEVHHNRERDPREPERLYEPEDELAAVVHDDEVVEVVEVEGYEAEERDDRGLEEAEPLVEFVVGVHPTEAQVRRGHHRPEYEQRLGDDEQQRPQV